MHPLYLLAVLLAGAGLSFQAAINARLREYAGSPTAGALISFLVGTVLLSAALAAGSPAAAVQFAKLRTAPWWTFLGGAIGVTYVLCAMISVPRIGSALLLAATVAGQLAAALAIDHNGWMGVPENPISAKRLVGAALLLGALWCFKK